MVEGFLFGMKIADDSLVHRSIRWSMSLLSYCFRSIATVSLNSVAIGRPTDGRAGAFLKILQTWHSSVTLRISDFKSLLVDHFSPAALTIFSSRSDDGWAKQRCNFFAMSALDFTSVTFNAIGYWLSSLLKFVSNCLDLVRGACNPFAAVWRGIFLSESEQLVVSKVNL